ncbi:MAG: site-specific DNA-methyltransferase, partial [Chromatiaceae bacterium]|nr:site-specific DNA-methyltransferase [Chromatiaceae bacterium]
MATDPGDPAANPEPPPPQRPSGTYDHGDRAVQRPAVGVQQEFPDRRRAKEYRYDSSLAPELCWDENAERDLVEYLLGLVEGATAAITGAAPGVSATAAEAAFFAQQPAWAGNGHHFDSLAACIARLKSLTKPFLTWSGKAERPRLRVPTIPIFVHERLSTQAILSTLETYKAVGTTGDLFGDPGLDIADQLDAYEHLGPWSNRLILGDSLQVMNSLLEYEGLGGQVQMVYMDPPYGVKFGSNFQPFVRKRDVKHGQDQDMIREPEMVKAYRDTWELGLHSYLTYLRDRLLFAKELLTESGSIFVQISDENLHHVREVMDEVFNNNFVSLITFSKTSSATSDLIPSTTDYLLWYAKDKTKVKYNSLYIRKVWGEIGDSAYSKVELKNGVRRPLTLPEKRDLNLLPAGAAIYRIGDLTSQRPPGNFPVTFAGKTFRPKRGYWKTGELGFQKLIKANRIEATSNAIYYVRYFNDFPVFTLSNLWDDTGVAGFTSDKLYVVQTNPKVVQRCLLMTTDPGDLVLDPTCGGGTTAYVAEQWGRRWITCDTSRVPLALTRQRLLTATFPWYDLKEPHRGPAGGFVYQRRRNKKGEDVGGLVPRITLKSIANNEEPQTVTLVDRPEVNGKITRVCGRFTVEATVQAARTLADLPAPAGQTPDRDRLEDTRGAYENPRRYLDRMIEVLRQSHTLRLPGNTSLNLAQVRPLSGEAHEYLHAEAEELGSAPSPAQAGGGSKRIAVVFGPEHGAIDSQLVFEAAREAYFLKFDALYLFGFAIQAKARELVADRKKLRLPCVYVSVTPDVAMSDLLKTSQSSQVFSVTGLPDVRVERLQAPTTGGDSLFRVELLGLDIFRPQDLETEAIAAINLPCWMLDTDYSGMVFMARQVFFPKTSAWENLEKSLRGRFAEGVWAHLAGTVSESFAAGPQRRIAVKVIDERGNELMVV